MLITKTPPNFNFEPVCSIGHNPARFSLVTILKQLCCCALTQNRVLRHPKNGKYTRIFFLKKCSRNTEKQALVYQNRQLSMKKKTYQKLTQFSHTHYYVEKVLCFRIFMLVQCDVYAPYKHK
jgi:hypothetical protein